MDIQEVILKILKKDEAAAEYNQLNEWKAETEENLKLYQEISKIVEEGDQLSDYREYNVESAYARFKKQIASPSKGWIKYAAIGLLVLAGAYFLLNTSSDSTFNDAPATYIAENATQAVDLKDGSTITLNQGAVVTELSDFSKIRNVELKGEAFFDISPDKNRPFRVQLNNETFVEVLGTSFNIINTDNELLVSVESGHVEVKAFDRTISLYKGDAVELVEDSLVKHKQTASNYLSWMNNELVFKNAPIASVLKDLSTHFEADFDVSDTVKNSECDLSSTFDTESLDQIMDELSKIVELSYTKEKDGSYLIKDIKCK